MASDGVEYGRSVRNASVSEGRKMREWYFLPCQLVHCLSL